MEDNRRNEAEGEQAEESPQVQSEKANQYIKELMSEKLSIDPSQNPNAVKLLEEEIKQVQQTGKINRPSKFVNVYREKPVKVTVKVLVPVKEHPKFNFVGKLLGPKGNSLKRLQEETMCKMAIFGRGSMRDRNKEEELRKSLDPKYSHLMDDLHVEVTALAPPAEAYARIAFALAEVRKYLIPDTADNIRQEQFLEMEDFEPRMPGGPPRGPPFRGGPPGGILHPRGGPPPMRPGPPARAPVPAARVMPPKAKIMSILDRARTAMNDYEGGGGDDYGYGGGYGGGYDYDGGDYYGGNDYEPQPPRWKSGSSAMPSRFRSAPYSRPGK